MSKQQKPPVTKTSTCNCGQVQVSVTGTDKGTVLCHCDNCKRGSGSAFAHNYRFTNAKLEILKGEGILKKYKDSNTKSGNALSRHFCSNCGSPILLVNPTFKNLYILHAGCIDGNGPQPSGELFKENKYGWLGECVAGSKL